MSRRPERKPRALEWRRSRRRCVVVVCLLCVAAMRGASTDSARMRTSELEARTPPGAFHEAARTAPDWVDVRYRVDATVQLPLLVVSIPVINRDDVGVAALAAGSVLDADGARLRLYEFFAASKPDRARGLNRLGFIREATALPSGAAPWSAQFGVISADRAETQEEAEAALNQEAEAQALSIIDAFVGPTHSTSATMTVDLAGRWTSADDFYRQGV